MARAWPGGNEGPFTVFAPTDTAFAELPAGTVESLLKPENKNILAKILTGRVVAGGVMSAALSKMIISDNGASEVVTVGGCVFDAKQMGTDIVIEDKMDNTAKVTIADVKQSNGVIHVTDSVLMPKM